MNKRMKNLLISAAINMSRVSLFLLVRRFGRIRQGKLIESMVAAQAYFTSAREVMPRRWLSFVTRPDCVVLCSWNGLISEGRLMPVIKREDQACYVLQLRLLVKDL